MDIYEDIIYGELMQWKREMEKKPTLGNNLSKNIQDKMNRFIPEKFHVMVTEVIKNMVKVVILGSEYTTLEPIKYMPTIEREMLVKEKIQLYRKAATLSGASTGFGGFFIGLADFPILLSIKIKLLYEIASIYGYDTKDYRERLYLLYIFQIAFCSDKRRIEVFHVLTNWKEYSDKLPLDKENFDWRIFQQEYRDYIDLAKFFQLVPVIGGAVGAVANYKLVEKLGDTAMNGYRLRYFD
ncbi:EcsC family protein [Clostridium subterminale]|uniref:EcsC family protein n=1 Tax=Clostridium subterminale TaxID=1550 RepID=A0ABN1KI25_CLOSU